MHGAGGQTATMGELNAGDGQKLMLLQMPDKPLIDKAVEPSSPEFVQAVQAVVHVCVRALSRRVLLWTCVCLCARADGRV